MRTKALLILILGACGDDGGGGMTDAAINPGFEPLIMSSWSLQPGTEIYQCATATVPRDMYISELRPIIPLGTHHTVVSIDTTPTAPDNPGYVCSDPFEFGGRFIYGTGVGSTPFTYPEGVGLHLRAGHQVHINLHLYNTGDTVMTGTSGVEIKAVASVVNEARFEIWGPQNLNIPPGTSTMTGTCTIATNINVVSFQPHMHQLGTHMKFDVTPAAGSPFVLYDRAYTFDGQEHVMIDPIVALKAGDQVRVDCTYNNTTSQTVTFGESSNTEMCFAAMTVYPATAGFCQ